VAPTCHTSVSFPFHGDADIRWYGVHQVPPRVLASSQLCYHPAGPANLHVQPSRGALAYVGRLCRSFRSGNDGATYDMWLL
ncbi:hypothetical protein M513_06468, partial [Trichuris suis]